MPVSTCERICSRLPNYISARTRRGEKVGLIDYHVQFCSKAFNISSLLIKLSSLAQLTYIKITQKNYHIFNTVLWKLRYNPTQMSSKMGNQRKIKSVPSKYCTSKFAKTAVKIKNLYTLKAQPVMIVRGVPNLR